MAKPYEEATKKAIAELGWEWYDRKKMFAELLSLICLLLLLNFAPTSGEVQVGSVLVGFGLLLLLLWLQGQLLRRRALFAMQIELLLFFLVALFPLNLAAVGRGYLLLPTVFVLLLYLIALEVGYSCSDSRKRATQQIRILLPFTFPIFLFTGALDLYQLLGGSGESGLAYGFALLFVLITMALLPPLLLRIWGCKSLPEGPLKTRLDALAKEANFTKSSLYIWQTLFIPTAALVGTFPRLRYLVFTELLLEILTDEEIAAAAAHEIGHHKKGHLLFFPFLMGGLFVVIALINELVLNPLSLAVLSIAVTLLYVRVVIGFFSQLFERQADLYSLELGLPAKAMIGALKQIAATTGTKLSASNWHHGSIQQRISVLEKAERDPSHIGHLNHFVTLCLGSYLLLLSGALFFYYAIW